MRYVKQHLFKYKEVFTRNSYLIIIQQLHDIANDYRFSDIEMIVEK